MGICTEIDWLDSIQNRKVVGPDGKEQINIVIRELFRLYHIISSHSEDSLETLGMDGRVGA